MISPLNFITKFIKSSNERELDRINKIVQKINLLEDEIIKLDDVDFPKKTKEFKEKIKQGTDINQILPEAFALVREASKRARKERHYDVQIVGGIVLHESKIAEMRTGEGKTLTIALAAYLNSLYEKGVHIVTVNDYLAKRDSIEMGEIYNFLGISSGYINNDQDDEERKKNYLCDVTYATNSELGFDYLRDNMKFSRNEMVERDAMSDYLANRVNQVREGLHAAAAAAPLLTQAVAVSSTSASTCTSTGTRKVESSWESTLMRTEAA